MNVFHFTSVRLDYAQRDSISMDNKSDEKFKIKKKKRLQKSCDKTKSNEKKYEQPNLKNAFLLMPGIQLQLKLYYCIIILTLLLRSVCISAFIFIAFLIPAMFLFNIFCLLIRIFSNFFFLRLLCRILYFHNYSVS